MTTSPYNVYDQKEAAAQSGEDTDLQKLIQSYTDRLNALGVPQGVTGDWMNAFSKDVMHGVEHPGSKTNAYGGANPGNLPSGIGIGGMVATAPLLGAGGSAFGFAGRKSWRKAQAAAAERQQQIDQITAEMQTKVAERKNTINNARGERTRANLSQMVSGMFDDPSRKTLYDNVYKTNLDNNLAQVQDAYKSALTHGVTRTADQGLVGGTVDTQRRGQLANTRDQGATQAAGAAGSARDAVRNRDAAMRAQLMQMINSGDPTQAASARAQLAQLDAQRQSVDEQTQMNQGTWNAQDYATQLNSQALGSGVGGLAAGAKQGSLWGAMAGSSGSGG